MEPRIRVVALQPNRLAEIQEIGSSLECYQQFVGGYIEAVYPFDEEVCLVCNEEDKLNGMELNRALRAENHEILDIIAGPCFLCSCEGEDFGSLTEEQAERYRQLFFFPERFVRSNRGIAIIPYYPENIEDEI